ncbi:hypothetical protein GCM10010112_18200 [Actinoplanes lobatus]|nr:hypothetical protein GCM10010112_18200 [Actinoplanes lobatus]
MAVHHRPPFPEQLPRPSRVSGLQWPAGPVEDEHNWMAGAGVTTHGSRHSVSRARVTPLSRYRDNSLPSPMLHTRYHRAVVSVPRFVHSRRLVC